MKFRGVVRGMSLAVVALSFSVHVPPLALRAGDDLGDGRPRAGVSTVATYRLFEAVPDEGPVFHVRLDAALWKDVQAQRKRFRVERFPLGRDRFVDLELESFTVTGPNTRFVVGKKGGADRPIDFDPASVSLFRGDVSGYPGSHVFLALHKNSSTGYVDLGGGAGRYFVSSKGADGLALPADELSIFEPSASANLPPHVPLCGVKDLDLSLAGDPEVAEPGSGAIAGLSSRVGLVQLELAVDTDYEYFALFNDETAATAYLIQVYGAVSDIYMRDVNTRVEVVFTRIWSDPNDLFNSPEPHLEFISEWGANMGHVHRDAVQLFSGRRDYPYGGSGELTALCVGGTSVIGYAVGFFPDPSKPSPFNWDVVVTAHELGHNCGAGHTHGFGLDTCDDPATTPSRGSIMSYCGQTWSGMNANIDNYFHTFIRQQMRDHIDSSVCIATDCNMNSVEDSIDISSGLSEDLNGDLVPDECQDCNNNGILDPVDLTGTSLDLNGNNIPDECEPDCNKNNIPDDRDLALGDSTDAYGNGIPDECEADCNNDGVSDYTEIQLNMPLDVDRNAVLDACQDCDADGTSDLEALAGAHGLWVASGLPNEVLRRFHSATGVLTATSAGTGVSDAQDLIVAPDGHVLVSSALDDRVMEFDPSGTYLGDFVPSGAGGLDYPTGLLMTSDDRLLVASRNTSSVLAYEYSDGTPLGEFVSAASLGLTAPFGLTFGPNGNLFVTSGTDEVIEYDGQDGTPIGVFVSAIDNGGLSQPRGLAFKSDGNLLVASFGTDEVLEFDGRTGSPLGKWAQVGTTTRITQDSPWGIRVGPSGHVYVSRTGTPFSSSPSSDDHDHLADGRAAGNSVSESHLTDARMFEYDVCTGLFRKTHIGGDDHGLFFATGFDFIPGWSIDCNRNELPDSCDISSGFSLDEDGSGVPDECEVDCNGNGTWDRLDIYPLGASLDCNCNLVPDECDLSSGLSVDTNANGRPDDCEPDCNNNGRPDDSDILDETSADCDANGVPDECQPDCNDNGRPDSCDLLAGSSFDCNANDVPDECDADCNGNGIADICEIENSTSEDCNTNGVPDECEVDCNANGVADQCEIADGRGADCDANGVLDECQATLACSCRFLEGQQLLSTEALDDLDFYSTDIAVSGDRLVVGAPREATWRGAAYVYRLDSGVDLSDPADDLWVLEQKLLPPDLPDDFFFVAFGFDVEIEGDRLAVSCIGSNDGAGSVYVYRFSDSGTPQDPNDDRWVEEQRLVAFGQQGSQLFGAPILLTSDRLVAGAFQGEDDGELFVFRLDRNATPADPTDDFWVEEARLVPSNPDARANFFGISAAMAGRWLFAGRFQAEDSLVPHLVYIFRRDDGGTPLDSADDVWLEHSTLAAPDGFRSSSFGNSIALTPDWAVMGATTDLGGSRTLVFRRDDNGTPMDEADDIWSEHATLTGRDSTAQDGFGCCGVAILGDQIIIGAPGEDHGCLEPPLGVPGLGLDDCDLGQAYVFGRDDNDTPADTADDSWVNVVELLPSDGFQLALFGTSVALSTEHYFVGRAPQTFLVEGAVQRGAVYVFDVGEDVNGNGIPDPCDVDCDGNGSPDDLDLLAGAPDCTGNAVLDECEPDCNDNGIADSCDIADQTSKDCTGNGVPDECEPDCNGNLIADSCEIADGSIEDCNANGVPDECEPDDDCNGNGTQDICDIANGTSSDCTRNAIPDECEPDCNGNGIPDSCDVALGLAKDCDANRRLDGCELTDGSAFDSDDDGALDRCCMAAVAPTETVLATNRFLAVSVPNADSSQAMRVRLTDLPPLFDELNGQTRWVGEPFEVTELSGAVDPADAVGQPTFWSAELTCEPFITDWTQFQTLHVYGEVIVPGGIYEVQTVEQSCITSSRPTTLTVLAVSTSAFGNIVGPVDAKTGVWTEPEPDGNVAIVTDAIAAIDKFSNRPGAPVKVRVDLEPETPDFRINILDIVHILDAFRGLPYPFVPTTLEPCPGAAR